jgi:AcrR family transcriptional regulator
MATVAGGSNAKREQIRRTAARLFAKHGYHATGVAELGDEVGLGRGALYHHIKSKEALLFDVSSAYVLPVVGFAEELVGMDMAPEEKLRRLSHMLMTAISENQDEGTVFLAEHRHLTGEYRRQIVEIRDRFEDACSAILEQGAEQGVFRPLNPVVVKGMLGMYNHSYLWLRRDGALSPDEIADIFYDLVLRGVTV